MYIKRMIVKDSGSTVLTHVWRDAAGDTEDVGDVTIGIVDVAGNTVVSAGTATTNSSGTYTYTLADQAQVNLLKVTWTDADTTYTRVEWYEVVGNLLFTETQARLFDNAALSNSSVYSDDDIWSAHTAIADELENMTGRSWIPRYRKLSLSGNGAVRLPIYDAYTEGAGSGAGADWDINEILSITLDNVDVSGSSIWYRNHLHKAFGVWNTPTQADPYNIIAEVEYGATNLIDGVDRMALLMLRDRLISDPTDFGGRAESLTTELGFYRIGAMPVEVSDWVKRHQYKGRF